MVQVQMELSLVSNSCSSKEGKVGRAVVPTSQRSAKIMMKKM
jgi:hypothetical protein